MREARWGRLRREDITAGPIQRRRRGHLRRLAEDKKVVNGHQGPMAETLNGPGRGDVRHGESGLRCLGEKMPCSTVYLDVYRSRRSNEMRHRRRCHYRRGSRACWERDVQRVTLGEEDAAILLGARLMFPMLEGTAAAAVGIEGDVLCSLATTSSSDRLLKKMGTQDNKPQRRRRSSR